MNLVAELQSRLRIAEAKLALREHIANRGDPLTLGSFILDYSPDPPDWISDEQKAQSQVFINVCVCIPISADVKRIGDSIIEALSEI